MLLFIIVFYGGILISLILLPFALYYAIKAFRIYITKNTVVEPRPAYTRFEDVAKKSDSNV